MDVVILHLIGGRDILLLNYCKILEYALNYRDEAIVKSYALSFIRLNEIKKSLPIKISTFYLSSSCIDSNLEYG